MSCFLEVHWDKWLAAPNGCYIWCAAHSEKGYGIVDQEGKNSYAHRVVCEETHGPRASFLKMDASHTCDEPRCVREEHVVWESRKENLARRSRENKRRAGSKAAFPYVVDSKCPKRPYRVRVRADGVQHTVGWFASPEEAIAARAAFYEAHGLVPRGAL